MVGLKANQDGLYEQVADWFERTKPTLRADVSRDVGHGRAEKRTVWVSDNLTLVEADIAQGFNQILTS